jgi:hypothetical protein
MPVTKVYAGNRKGGYDDSQLTRVEYQKMQSIYPSSPLGP